MMAVSLIEGSLSGKLHYLQLRIWIQSDNTVKELRNTFTSRALCMLLHQGAFRIASEMHLVKGHTHEDVDAIFAVCANYLRSAADLQTPRDIQRRLQDKVARIFESKGIAFSVDVVGEVPSSL